MQKLRTMTNVDAVLDCSFFTCGRVASSAEYQQYCPAHGHIRDVFFPPGWRLQLISVCLTQELGDIHSHSLLDPTLQMIAGTFTCTLCSFSAPFVEKGQRINPDPDIAAARSNGASNIV